MHGMEGPSLCLQLAPPSGSLHAHIILIGECRGHSSFFPTYLGPGQSVPVSWPETFLRLSLTASRYWQGLLALPTAWLGLFLLPVATGRVHLLPKLLLGLIVGSAKLLLWGVAPKGKLEVMIQVMNNSTPPN